MLHDMLTQVFVQTFLKEVGKFNTEKALKISFNIPIDHIKEDGYRQLDLLIYSPMNYVGVYIRERWTVISLDDLEEDEDGEPMIKPGKDYQNGQSAWDQICYHDSGWRAAISSLLFKRRGDLNGFNNSPDFYEVVDVPVELKPKG